MDLLYHASVKFHELGHPAMGALKIRLKDDMLNLIINESMARYGDGSVMFSL